MARPADTRLWHPWLRINRLLRVMLHERWSAEVLAAGERLEPFFGPLRAARLTSADVVRYTNSRREQGAANATVNRELAALKRALTLAHRWRQVDFTAGTVRLESFAPAWRPHASARRPSSGRPSRSCLTSSTVAGSPSGISARRGRGRARPLGSLDASRTTSGAQRSET
jgi:hypothetical protein